MELQNLEAFQLVARLQSFSKAAETLHITQSAITLRIKAMEKELEQQLFIRTSRKVELSPAGIELLPFVEKALQQIELGKQKLEKNVVSRMERLNIAANPTISFREIPRLVSIMSRKWPNIRINVLTGRTNFVMEKLLSGEAHIGLIRTPLPQFDLYYKRLFDEDLVLVVSTRDSLAALKTIDIKDLNGIKMIVHDTTTAFGQWMMNLFASKGVVPEIIIENDYFTAIKEMIIQGVGAAILPVTTVEDEINKGYLKAIKILGAGKLVSSVIVACQKNKVNSPEISAFLLILTKIYRSGHSAAKGR